MEKQARKDRIDFEKHIVGYTDQISVIAGDTQSFMVSSPKDDDYSAELVQLICGDTRTRGAGFKEVKLSSSLDGSYNASYQPLVRGSYGLVENATLPRAGTLELHFFPTLLSVDAEQCLVSLGALDLCLNVERLCVRYSEVSHSLNLPLRLRRWHSVKVTWSKESLDIDLAILGLGTAEKSTRQSACVDIPPHLFDEQVEEVRAPLVLAARLDGGMQQTCFNGKLEHLRISKNGPAKGKQVLIAEWRFEKGLSGDTFVDDRGGLTGAFHNCPVRGTKGIKWDASVHDHRQNQEHYGAVHFHDDDLTDACWQPSLAWQVPVDLKSGQYALKLTQGTDVDYIPFFVRPAPQHARADVAYLASTATYMAYANQRIFLGGAFAAPVKNANDAYLRDNIEVGLSLYEHHSDGSGVHFSSYLRPVLNLKPQGTMWSFNADTNITAWLNEIDTAFDVITDEDLHREGATLLSNYKVVVTGTHPEYYSVDMLDGVEHYLAEGGRLMYMGGNGFYWKIAYHPDNPAIIEVRRAEDGTRAWMAEPGDYHHAFDGELGGLWRRNGRPPNQIVGIGFAAQGFDGATHYRLKSGAQDARASFIFEGTSGAQVIGDYGSIEGGAAGQEIDRWDPDLGSPVHALVLASSENHKPGMLRVVEELHMSVPYLQGSKVKADITFFETQSGGAVFSTGSISYAGSLSHNNYNNDICKITTNVLKRFADPLPFEYPEHAEDLN